MTKLNVLLNFRTLVLGRSKCLYWPVGNIVMVGLHLRKTVIAELQDMGLPWGEAQAAAKLGQDPVEEHRCCSLTSHWGLREVSNIYISLDSVIRY